MPNTTWDDVEKESESSSGKFIRLKDGEFIEGVFAGQPYQFYASFAEKKGYEKWAEGRSKRYRVNFIVKGEAKIFESGTTTFKAIVAVIKEYGQENVFKIKREGSGKENTTYHVLFRAPLAQEDYKKITGIKLNSLSVRPQESDSDSDFDGIPDATEPPPDDSDIPF